MKRLAVLQRLAAGFRSGRAKPGLRSTRGCAALGPVAARLCGGSAAALLLALALGGCATGGLYYWGGYEDSLYLRERDTSDAGQARAFTLVEDTIREAEARQARVPPGVYADYGYLLYRQGRRGEALEAFRKEAAAYPESKPFMDAVIARVEAVTKPDDRGVAR